MFLTLEDPNAKIKGSRDPLGAQPIWALFARHVVTNLTTVSNSVRGFTILLLARYLCARLIEENVVTRDDALNVFLRTEQIGSYARHVGHGVEGDIRGIERVKKFLEEGRGKVTIAADHSGFILGDQKVYGLWGLYSVSARVSGLIPEGPVGVEPAVGEFIERNYLPRLQPAMSQIMRLLSKGGRLDTKRKDPTFLAFADILTKGFTSQEVDFYGRYLRDGLEVDTPHKGRQANLRKLLESHADLEQTVGRAELIELVKRARPMDSALADRLERIVNLEAVLAPADALFQHALTQTGQQPSNVAKRVKAQWGALVPNIDPAAFERLIAEVSEASSEGNSCRYPSLCRGHGIW